MELTHLHLMLDRIREAQHDQGSLLLDIVERQDENLRHLRTIGKLLRDKPKGKAISLPQGSVTVGIQYLAAMAAVVYLLKGGDLEKVAGLVKLLGLL